MLRFGTAGREGKGRGGEGRGGKGGSLTRWVLFAREYGWRAGGARPVVGAREGRREGQVNGRKAENADAPRIVSSRLVF